MADMFSLVATIFIILIFAKLCSILKVLRSIRRHLKYDNLHD